MNTELKLANQQISHPSRHLVTMANSGRLIIVNSSCANLSAAARTKRWDFFPILYTKTKISKENFKVTNTNQM